MRNPLRIYLMVLTLILVALGCSKAEVPTVPDQIIITDNQERESSAGLNENRRLWGTYIIEVNEDRTKWEILPMRGADGHWNVLKWLEQEPCKDCLKVKNIRSSGSGTVFCDIEITHPLSNPNFTVFDVRGI